jgi:16S rRNA (cytidine1402-2'-O)-methyltransferase
MAQPATAPINHSLAPGLYVTATPIGNARDITLRALDVLQGCDLIAAEDTRVTAKLLAIYGISKPLIVYNDHNAAHKRPKLLARLREGARIVLVSDAGTPLVSDPGFKLVREALAQGRAVHAIPGASAALAATVISGIPAERFYFTGFLPSKQSERRRTLEAIRAVPGALVLFESGPRLAASLGDMLEILGPRPAAVTRELTKLHEEVWREDLRFLAARWSEQAPPKGEITIVVAAPAKPEADMTKVDRVLVRALAEMPLRSAVQLVSEALELPRHAVYKRALSIRSDDSR